MTATITFQMVADGTEVTVHQANIPDTIPDDDAEASLTDLLGNLADTVGA
ncbi:hypothetical protein [Haladaptatus halobius]|nr:hypothetical protein [Haladaptatus halobius]